MSDRRVRPSLRVGLALALCGSLLGATGCPTNDDPAPSQDSDGQDSDGNEACDPVGANAEMGALLNAPVADDVEVIVKQPQHPGPAGPANLP